MIHGLPIKSSKSDCLRIRNEYSAHTQKIGCGQSSRSLPQARRIVGSGDENGRIPAVTKLTYKLTINITKYPSICRSLSLMCPLGKLNHFSTSGARDCGSNSFPGLHFNYYSASGVQDFERNSFAHLTLIII